MDSRQFSKQVVVCPELFDFGSNTAIVHFIQPSLDGLVDGAAFRHSMHLRDRRSPAPSRFCRGRGLVDRSQSDLRACLLEQVTLGVVGLEPCHDLGFNGGTGCDSSKLLIGGLPFSRGSHTASSS